MTTADDKPIVLYYAPDNASFIVRLALEELALPYETRLVDRGSNAQQSAEYRKLNPNGLIPAAIVDNQVLFETAAILLIVNDRHPGLAPARTESHYGDFLKWLLCLSNGLHADLKQRFYPDRYIGDDPDMLAVFNERCVARINKQLAMFDDVWQQQEGAYLFGRDPCMVDLYLATCLRWLQLYPREAAPAFQFSHYPNLLNLATALEERPAIQRAISSEGMNHAAFSAALQPEPPEGSAL